MLTSLIFFCKMAVTMETVYAKTVRITTICEKIKKSYQKLNIHHKQDFTCKSLYLLMLYETNNNLNFTYDSFSFTHLPSTKNK